MRGPWLYPDKEEILDPFTVFLPMPNNWAGEIKKPSSFVKNSSDRKGKGDEH
jgi:hypothetical protein